VGTSVLTFLACCLQEPEEFYDYKNPTGERMRGPAVEETGEGYTNRTPAGPATTLHPYRQDRLQLRQQKPVLTEHLFIWQTLCTALNFYGHA
jgi:hypothetical protein